jgi:transcription initiation factor IIE alpha subunit
MIWISQQFIRAFSSNEQLIMLQLLLHADLRGIVEFSDRGISKITGISYQQVRTIHQKWLEDGTITNATTNAPINAKHIFVTICDYDSYNAINTFSNAVTNAVTNAFNEDSRKEKVSTQTTTIEISKEIEELKKENERLKEELANASKKKEEHVSDLHLFPEEVESEKNKIAFFNYQKFTDFFNNSIKTNGCRIKKIRKIDNRRKNVLHARMMDYGYDAVFEVVQKATKSLFLNGGGKQGWVADFDWLFGPDNFRKVIEGKYDDIQSDCSVSQVQEMEQKINWQ